MAKKGKTVSAATMRRRAFRLMCGCGIRSFNAVVLSPKRRQRTIADDVPNPPVDAWRCFKKGDYR